MRISSDTAVDRECLQRRYRPARVRLLFVGEAPPASGRFFYCANSGLYRTIRDTFVTAFPALGDSDFLGSFRALGCYLVDLCATPVDRLASELRAKTCTDAEARLTRTVQDLCPKIIITVVRSIAPNVMRSLQQANWRGAYYQLPYPGRWRHHRVAFEASLVPVLQRELGKDSHPGHLRSNDILGNNFRAR